MIEIIENIFDYYMVITLLSVLLTLVKVMIQIKYYKMFIKGKAIPNVVIFEDNQVTSFIAFGRMDVRYLINQILKSVFPLINIYQIFINTVFMLNICLYYANKKHFSKINKVYLTVTSKFNAFLSKGIF